MPNGYTRDFQVRIKLQLIDGTNISQMKIKPKCTATFLDMMIEKRSKSKIDVEQEPSQSNMDAERSKLMSL